jgi:hypothetical protein
VQQVGVGRAGQHRVDGDAAGAQFPGGDRGELLHRALASRVGGDSRAGDHRVHRGHVDDPAAVAHVPGGVPHGEEHRLGVHRHHAVVLVLGQVGQGDRGEPGRRVVDEDVQPVEVLVGLLEQPLDGAGFTEVDLHRVGRATRLRHGPLDLGGGGRVAQVPEDHGRSVARQPLHDGSPDTPRAARHHRCLAVE